VNKLPAIYAIARAHNGYGMCCPRCANFPGPDDRCPVIKLDMNDDGEVVWISCTAFLAKEDAL
jgi:hypothetical protein